MYVCVYVYVRYSLVSWRISRHSCLFVQFIAGLLLLHNEWILHDILAGLAGGEARMVGSISQTCQSIPQGLDIENSICFFFFQSYPPTTKRIERFHCDTVSMSNRLTVVKNRNNVVVPNQSTTILTSFFFSLLPFFLCFFFPPSHDTLPAELSASQPCSPPHIYVAGLGAGRTGTMLVV